MAYVSQESICKTLLTDANKALKNGDVGSADALYIAAVERIKNATGPDHPRMAAVLLRLGDFYKDQKKFEQAEVQFRRAMCIYEGAFGLETLDVAICLPC